MAFKVGDKVKLRLTRETLDRLNMTGAHIDNKIVTIGQVYALDYEPDQTLYMVDLTKPIEHEGTEIDEIYDLRDVDLDLVDANEPMEEKVLRFGEFITESQEEPSWYYGIADCRGVESFVKEPDRNRWSSMDRLHDLGLSDADSSQEADKQELGRAIGLMSLRAMHNQQRHPVVYRVLLDQETAEEVEDLLAHGEYEEALITIKDRALEVQLGRGHGSNLEKRWRMIPNPDLDPMG